jgi:hypothetical protein
VQLGLEIGPKLDINATKLQRYQETISELQTKIDELEIVAASLTG